MVIVAYNNDDLQLKLPTSSVQNFSKMQVPPQKSMRQ